VVEEASGRERSPADPASVRCYAGSAQPGLVVGTGCTPALHMRTAGIRGAELRARPDRA
jgi:hypothetical protein